MIDGGVYFLVILDFGIVKETISFYGAALDWVEGFLAWYVENHDSSSSSVFLLDLPPAVVGGATVNNLDN